MSEQDGRGNDTANTGNTGEAFGPRLDALNRKIPPVYANDTNVAFGDEDVSIVFGYTVDGSVEHPSLPAVRIVMTHSSFIKMVGFWNKRVDFLRKIYGDAPIGLAETNPDRDIVLQAFREMVSEE